MGRPFLVSRRNLRQSQRPRCERQMGIFVVVTVALYALLPKEEDSLLSVFLLQTSASGQ